MRYLLYAVAMLGAGSLGLGGLYVGYRMGQSRFGRGKTETIQTLFSRITFK
jgi:hypothetical protein